jgi:hypothetical protein
MRARAQIVADAKKQPIYLADLVILVLEVLLDARDVLTERLPERQNDRFIPVGRVDVCPDDDARDGLDLMERRIVKRINQIQLDRGNTYAEILEKFAGLYKRLDAIELDVLGPRKMPRMKNCVCRVPYLSQHICETRPDGTRYPVEERL